MTRIQALSTYLVVDDHALLREGIVSVIHRVAPSSQIDQAENLRDAMGLLRRHAGAIDMVVLDLDLPDSRQLDTLCTIKAAAPMAHIAVVSAHSDLDLATACIREGACAFVPKTGSLVSFQHALQLAAQGGMYFPRELLVSAGALAHSAPETAPSLTPRQQEVLVHLLKGCSNPQIATALRISAETVKLHVSAILAAYGVANRVQLVLSHSAMSILPPCAQAA